MDSAAVQDVLLKVIEAGLMGKAKSQLHQADDW